MFSLVVEIDSIRNDFQSNCHLIMSQIRQRNENDDDDESEDESTRRNSSDGLEFVPTLLKIKQVVLLRHSTFHRLINEFNQTLESFTRDEPHFLQFQVIRQTDSTIFWKALVRIRCQKICRANQHIDNEIVLNLQQFLSVHQSLSQQIVTLQKCSTPILINTTTENSNSSSFSSAKLSFPLPNDNECCICLDRQPNLVLPCTHKFCDQCFSQWSSQTTATSSQTCPLCRVAVNEDSGFLLAETPKYDNMKKMLTESILSLPDDYKTRQ